MIGEQETSSSRQGNGGFEKAARVDRHVSRPLPNFFHPMGKETKPLTLQYDHSVIGVFEALTK